MERFAISLSGKELYELSQRIIEYEIKPVYLSSNALKSFHPVEINGTLIVVLFCWEDNCPITVYRENWFEKLDTYRWVPKKIERVRAKDRRMMDKIRTLNQKPTSKEKFKQYHELLEPFEI
jgi:hypothetical protein